MNLLGRIGWPTLALAALQLGVVAATWPALLGLNPTQGGALFGVWWVAGGLGGLLVGGRLLYGGDAPTLRRRLVLGALRFDGFWIRTAVILVALALGDLAGRLLTDPGAIESATGLDAWTALLIAILMGVLGYVGAIAALFMVVVPLGFLLASVIPKREADEEPRGSIFTVMSTGELRGGSMTMLALAWLIPGLLLMGYRVGGEGAARLWLLSCGVAVALIVVGIVINNSAVRERNRSGVTTPFDDATP